jgi:hypothetical protein
MVCFKTPKASQFQETITVREKILRMDLPGAIVVLGAVLCYLLALQWGGTSRPWSSSHVYGLLIGFGLLLTLFVGVEWWQGPRALCVPHLLRQRLVWVGCIYSFL